MPLSSSPAPRARKLALFDPFRDFPPAFICPVRRQNARSVIFHPTRSFSAGSGEKTPRQAHFHHVLCQTTALMCSISHVRSDISHVRGHISHVRSHAAHVRRDISHVRCPISHVRSHAAHVGRDISHVRCGNSHVRRKTTHVLWKTTTGLFRAAAWMVEPTVWLSFGSPARRESSSGRGKPTASMAEPTAWLSQTTAWLPQATAWLPFRSHGRRKAASVGRQERPKKLFTVLPPVRNVRGGATRWQRARPAGQRFASVRNGMAGSPLPLEKLQPSGLLKNA